MDNLNRHIVEIYNRHSSWLYSVAYRILNNSAEAEDAIQESIIKYYKSFRLIKIIKPESYLKSICVRECLDILRKRKVADAFTQEALLQNEESTTEEVMYEDVSALERTVLGRDEQEIIKRIKDRLLQLSEGYRVVLSLYLFEGYDYTEIAQILGVKESSVRSQYLRGKIKLLELIEKDFIKN